MYEHITYEMILQRMLDGVPNTIDKREGSIIYDALAPAAAEVKQMYIEADGILNETFADTASRGFLIKRVAERGVFPNPSSNSILKGIFNKNVPIGSRFSLDDLNYIVTENLDGFEFKLMCETKGAEGNLHFGSLIPIDYIDGLTSAELTEVLIPGEDEEATEVLRTRYFSTLDSQSFGGNIADYKEKVNKIQGVGGVKVYPVWDGGGTVKLVIINSQYQRASNELIDEVQTIVDPVTNQGKGVGIAPIGHVVTVIGVVEATINILTNIIYQDGWTWVDIQNYVEVAIDDYFLELNQNWSLTNNVIIRISQIETRLLNLTGILDISGTSINGVEENLVLDAYSIPVRGEVVG